MHSEPPFSPSTTPGTVHLYAPRLAAFEHHPAGPASPQPTHTLLWITGLSGGLNTVPYVAQLAQSLPSSWRLVQPLLLSSFDQWGIRTLASDAAELANCVRYFRSLRPAGSKIVLMGHSTGCQDCMEYVLGVQNTDASTGGVMPGEAEARPTVDGVVLQAPASDREALAAFADAALLKRGIEAARAYVRDGRADDILPSGLSVELLGEAPVTARRWLSLTSPEKLGEDDFFSSDLGDEKLRSTFGNWPQETSILILYSEKDEYVPESIDKNALVKTWERFLEGAGATVNERGGVVPHASHNLKGDSAEVVGDMVRRVISFCVTVAGNEGVGL